MYLLDTMMISQLDPTRHKHAPQLIDWMERNGAGLYVSVLTITEMDTGVLRLRRIGKTDRAADLTGLVSAVLGSFSSRLLPVDLETARHVARLREETHQRKVALPDLIIAATAARHGLVVLTRNMRDFGRLSVKALNPYDTLPPDL